MGADILKNAIYVLSAVASIFLGTVFVSSGVCAQNNALSHSEIKSIPGYTSYGTLSSFTKHLQDDPVLYRALSSNQKLSEKIMGSTTLQRKLLGDIKKSGDSQSVVSSYVSEFSQTGDVTGNAFGQTDSFARQEEQRQKRRELNQQQLSGDEDGANQGSQRLGSTNANANLAAQRAIEQAQRIKEAADRRAEEMIAKAQTQLDVQNEQENFQSEMLRFKAVQDMISQIAHDPAALDAFWADTQMLQKLMDKEMTIEDAMAELGITPDPSDDTLFGDGFEGGGNEGLVHVFGNKYQIDGRDVYDLNHVPSEDEKELDGNGWPKFLNVPAECGPANPDVSYIFENRYGRGSGAGGSSLIKGAAMDWIQRRGVLFSGHQHDVGLTDDEIFSAPFYVPNTSLPPGRYMNMGVFSVSPFVPDLHTGVRGGFFSFSLSHCPGDWSNTTPPGENPLLGGCVRKFGLNFNAYDRIALGLKEASTPDIYPEFLKHVRCNLEPGKRYFFNFAAPHHADPGSPSITESMLEKMKRLARFDPERYPHSPEENLQNYIDSPGIPDRGGKFVGSAGWFVPALGNLLMQYLPHAPRLTPAAGRHPLRLSNKGNYYQLADLKVGRNRPTAQCTSAGEQILFNRTCYDPHGKLPTKRIVLECSGPGTASWVEGYDESLFSDYICIDTAAGINSKFCVAGNEGTFRRVEYKNPHLSRNPSTNTVEQCQFDKARGRFDWIAVEARPSSKDLGGHPNHNRVVYSQTADIPPRRSCVIGDKVVQLGGSVSLNCPNVTGSNISDSSFSYTLSCQQVADEPALPALVNENGYNINRMVTDPESGIRVESLLSWLPQCELQ